MRPFDPGTPDPRLHSLLTKYPPEMFSQGFHEACRWTDRYAEAWALEIAHALDLTRLTDAATPEEAALSALFGAPGTFFVDDDHLLRGTSDRAYSALLLARRGERGIRPRILDLMDAAGREDFHALALAMEALEALDAPQAPEDADE